MENFIKEELKIVIQKKDRINYMQNACVIDPKSNECTIDLLNHRKKKMEIEIAFLQKKIEILRHLIELRINNHKS